jgi:hypothetical protein
MESDSQIVDFYKGKDLKLVTRMEMFSIMKFVFTAVISMEPADVCIL